MTKLSRIPRDLLAFVFIGLATGTLSAAQNMVTLKGHVLKQIQTATLLQRAAPDELVSLSLVVRLDQTLLDQTLAQMYGPGSPAQKHYLSSQEFAQEFGLAEKRQAIKDFAQANGLTVDTADEPESMVVKVSGPVSAVEKAFNVQLNHYRTADGRLFRAHETDPMIPASLAPHLGAVMGLSNLRGIYHPHLRMRPLAAGSAQPAISGGTGPGGTLFPADIKTIYGLSQTTFTGTGQTIALFELDGYAPSDVTGYEANVIPPISPTVTVTYVGVDGTVNLCGTMQNQTCNSTTLASDNGMVEVALDIDMALALAPGVTQILVYDNINAGAGSFDNYNKIATDNIAKIVSTSWGLDEQDTGSAEVNAEATLFQRMAAQGQTVYAASGDCGAYDQQDLSGNCITNNGFRVDDPASQPFVTGVGGTSLAGTLSSPIETAWGTFPSPANGSGGGVSTFWTLPSYQAGVAGTASQQFRNVPDVALNANPASGYAVYVGGGFLGGAVGGTSAAAPLWAAFTALANQQSVSAGNSVLGFANPTLYSLAVGSTYSADFTDIKSGTNVGFSASTGYDNVTGLGSFKGAPLISSIGGVLYTANQANLLENLLEVYAYPNPWDTRKYSFRFVTIANVPDDATVKIFTISGFWVKSLTPASNKAVWDLTNDRGDRVASGLYFYLVNSPVAKTRGEIAIIK